MSYEKTSLKGMQSYQRTGGWKRGPVVYPEYGYYGGGPAYAMFGEPSTEPVAAGMDVSRILFFYLLPASLVLLGAWAVVKIYDVTRG
jgi:hypothetical protein